MKLIVCLDDRNGMLFNGRRQSRDYAVCRDILDVSGNAPVWMRPDSKKLFSDTCERIHCYEQCPPNLPEDAYLFLEFDPVESLLPLADVLMIYRWNRVYPADVRFTVEMPDPQWKLVEVYDFPGNSHNTLTREVYVR